jgi:hypothetical protein
LASWRISRGVIECAGDRAPTPLAVAARAADRNFEILDRKFAPTTVAISLSDERPAIR